METLDLDTVFLKNYVELSTFEKEEMKDLFSNEDEFMQMKFTFSSINKMLSSQKSEPSIEVKKNLDSLYYSTYQNKGVLWYNSIGTFFIDKEKTWYNQNILKLAAVVTLVLAVYPLLNSSLDSKVVLSKNSRESSEEIVSKSKNAKAENLDFTAVVKKQKLGISNEILLASNVSVKKDFLVPEIVSTESMEIDLSWEHPDGVFVENTEISTQTSSFSVESNPDFLDLLTPSY